VMLQVGPVNGGGARNAECVRQFDCQPY
jgi:hypothetical protein